MIKALDKYFGFKMLSIIAHTINNYGISKITGRSRLRGHPY